MECSHEDTTDGIRIIRLSGRMDIEGNDEVAMRFTALTISGGSAVVVDLSRLNFIGSLGIGTLVSAARALKLRKGALALFGADSHVSTALHRTNIPTMIPTCDTLDEARAAVAASA